MAEEIEQKVSKKKLKVINLLGAPGSGKTTTMNELFSLLKRDGHVVENAPEFAKELVWAHRLDELQNQLFVTGTQLNRLWILKDKVDIVITDSPVILGIQYAPAWLDKESFKDILMNSTDQFDNKWFFINRVREYDPKGRTQTEEESNKIREDLIKLINDLDIYPEFLDGKDGSGAIIRSYLEKDNWIPKLQNYGKPVKSYN